MSKNKLGAGYTWYTTGDIARAYGISVPCIGDWMTKGFTLPDGRVARLQYMRIGRLRKVRSDWFEHFLAEINVDTPRIVETPAEHSQRMDAAVARMNAAFSS